MDGVPQQSAISGPPDSGRGGGRGGRRGGRKRRGDRGGGGRGGGGGGARGSGGDGNDRAGGGGGSLPVVSDGDVAMQDVVTQMRSVEVGGRGRNRHRKRGKGGGGGGRTDAESDDRGGKRLETAPGNPAPALPLAPAPADLRDSSGGGASKDPSFMTKHPFSSLPPSSVHPDTLRALTEVMKLERMTEIQHKTLRAAGLLVAEGIGEGSVGRRVRREHHPGGIDVLGRARTGTGKTLAFLVPSLQTVIDDLLSASATCGAPTATAYTSKGNKNDDVNGRNYGRRGGRETRSSPTSSVRILVVSPTRELATQIANQGDALLAYHKHSRLNLSIQVVFGGTNIKSDVSRFNDRIPTVLVATPGRLKDHLQNTRLPSGRPFSDCVSRLKVLVLDEADQLLEMGFRPDIQTIISYLPRKENRQTLLFSATMPKELRSVMADTMKPDYVTVDCIHDRGATSRNEINAHVVQSHVVLPSMDRIVVCVVEVLLSAIEDARASDGRHKIICFFSTARLTGFFSDLFNVGMNVPVIEMHSRKSQSARNKASDQFRRCKEGVLFTSDVSARGVDYPDVTHVIQFGLPDNREQYIHRLGRTGRAGRAGKGWLVLAHYERSFLDELRGVRCPPNPDLQRLFDGPPSKKALDLFVPVLNDIGNGHERLVKSAELAYVAWLGFYNSNTRRIGKVSKEELVRMANEFGRLTGLRKQPVVLKRTVGKMGLKGVPGLRVE